MSPSGKREFYVGCVLLQRAKWILKVENSLTLFGGWANSKEDFVLKILFEASKRNPKSHLSGYLVEKVEIKDGNLVE